MRRAPASTGTPESLARALEKLEMATSVRPLPVNPAVAHMFIVNPLNGHQRPQLQRPVQHPPTAGRAHPPAAHMQLTST